MNELVHSVGLGSRAGEDIGGPGSGAHGLHPPVALHPMVEATAALLRRLFRGFDGTLAMRLWNGTPLKLGSTGGNGAEPPFTLLCRSPSAVRTMVVGRDPLRLAEAYFRDDIDIEGDFFAALGLKDHLHAIRLSPRDRLGALLSALRLPAAGGSSAWAGAERSLLRERNERARSKTGSREAIAFHYEVSNEFYALWLDEAMVYPCAYFEQPGDDLAQAQRAKLDHICRKLRLQPGERLLDIGCGWGALVIHAATHYGVRAHGITLSRRQLALARRRIARAGLQERVTVDLCDYRDLPGESLYDKVSSIGMFEHVGLNNLPVYFAAVHRLLKPAGLFLNHGITHVVEGWSKTLSTEFINRVVFPGGQPDTIGNIQRVMERARFEIADVGALRHHYALTLRHWVSRLERHHTQALRYVGESTYESGACTWPPARSSSSPAKSACTRSSRANATQGARLFP